jgi:hypothetical protein
LQSTGPLSIAPSRICEISKSLPEKSGAYAPVLSDPVHLLLGPRSACVDQYEKSTVGREAVNAPVARFEAHTWSVAPWHGLCELWLAYLQEVPILAVCTVVFADDPIDVFACSVALPPTSTVEPVSWPAPAVFESSFRQRLPRAVTGTATTVSVIVRPQVLVGSSE